MSLPSVLLVGKGPPDAGGISAMITTLQTGLGASWDVGFLNLTRPADYEAGVLSTANITRTITDTIDVFRAARGRDVVYLHSAFVPAVTILRAIVLLIAARLAGARTVLHVHGGSLPAWASSGWKSTLARLAATVPDRVIAVSDEITEAIGRRRSRTIANGVDTTLFSPTPGRSVSPPTVVYVGLLTRRKGVVDLMEASRILRERGVAHRLVIVGGRPDEGDAEEAVVREAASGEEEFTGAISHREVAPVLADADVFCLPSWWEAMPLSVLEAMASGLPVVATRVGRVPEVVTEDVGRLVPPRDPASLADALEELLTRPELRTRLGTNARSRAESAYSVSKTIAEISAVLESAQR